MYRPLGDALPRAAPRCGACRRRCCWRAGRRGYPCAYDLLGAQLLRPAAWHERAARLPVAPRLQAQSGNRASRRHAVSRVARARDLRLPPCSLGERVRRQVPGFTWPHEGSACRQQVLVAGSGSGHQVAQLLLAARMRRHVHRPVRKLAGVRRAAAGPMPASRGASPPWSPHGLVCEPASRATDEGGSGGGVGGSSGAQPAAAPPNSAAAAAAAAAALGRRFHLVCCI